MTCLKRHRIRVRSPAIISYVAIPGCLRLSTYPAFQHILRKLRKQAHAAISRVIAEDAALVSAELDRLGGRTQLLHTVSDWRVACHSVITRDEHIFLGRRKEQSVFETQANPNGYVQGLVVEDQRMDDPVPIANPPGYDSVEINFSDFLNEQMLQAPQGRVPQEVPMDFAQMQGTQSLDWIQSFLEMTGGTPQPPTQAQAPTDPVVPTPAEMDATWQALVTQLGI